MDRNQATGGPHEVVHGGSVSVFAGKNTTLDAVCGMPRAMRAKYPTYNVRQIRPKVDIAVTDV